MKILTVKNVDPAFDAYHEIFNSLGHESHLISSRDSLEVIENAIESHKPDFVLINNTDIFSENHRKDGPAVEDLFLRKGVPVAIWDFEAPYFVGGSGMMARWFRADYFKSFYFLNIDTYWVEEYRKHGNACDFLPFGVDPRLENYRPDPALVSSFEAPVTYIGSAMIKVGDDFLLDVIDDSLCDYFLNRFRAAIFQNTLYLGLNDDQLKPLIQSFDENVLPILAEVFWADRDPIEDFSRDAAQIMSSVDQFYLNKLPVSPGGRMALSHYISASIPVFFSFWQLTHRLDQLIPLGLRVYGEGNWPGLLKAYAHSVRRLSYPEMYAAYRGSSTVFCYTKKLFHHNVHERVLHILGTGGLPLSDYRRDLDLLFEKEEFVPFRHIEEAKDQVRFYSSNPEARHAQVAKGRARVFRTHTYTHRIHELIALVSKHYGLNSKPHRETFSLPVGDYVEKMYHAPKRV